MFLGMGQGVVGDERSNVGKFSRLSLEEFLTSGSIEKQIAYRDRCSFRQAGFFDLENLSAIDFDHCAGRLVLSLSFQAQSGNGCDRGQCLAAKTESGHVQQILCVFDL